MKPSSPNHFFRIIATLLVLTSLQSCDVTLGLFDLGFEMFRDWLETPHSSSGGGYSYKSSGGGRTYRPTYRPSSYKPKSKGNQETIQETIEEKKIKTKKEKCTVCNGMGLVEWSPEFYMSDNWCKICQHKKKTTHRHPRKCKECDGEGVIHEPIEETNK